MEKPAQFRVKTNSLTFKTKDGGVEGDRRELYGSHSKRKARLLEQMPHQLEELRGWFRRAHTEEHLTSFHWIEVESSRYKPGKWSGLAFPADDNVFDIC